MLITSDNKLASYSAETYFETAEQLLEPLIKGIKKDTVFAVPLLVPASLMSAGVAIAVFMRYDCENLASALKDIQDRINDSRLQVGTKLDAGFGTPFEVQEIIRPTPRSFSTENKSRICYYFSMIVFKNPNQKINVANAANKEPEPINEFLAKATIFWES